MNETEKRCPDDGHCTHLCLPGRGCFRVKYCVPLSGVFPEDEWPDAVLDEHCGDEQDLPEQEFLVEMFGELMAEEERRKELDTTN